MPEPGVARAEVTLASQYESYPGVVHGGIVAAILDECGGRAHMEDPDKLMVTAQLKVRFRKPVPIETPLIVIGSAGRRRGRVAEAHSEIMNENGEVLAEAELVLVDIPESQLAGLDREALGWRVYSEEEA